MNRGADHIAEVLAESGVERLFSLSGNQIMPLYDACLEPGISIVHTRHESSAVFMAESYAQLSGCPGVALVTAAPGFANALGALYSAKQSETPVILISGDSPVSQDGAGAFQEFDQASAVRPFVKLTQRVTDITRFREQWQLCWQQACGGVPGPVHLSLPFDVLGQVAEKTLSATAISVVDETADAGHSDELDFISRFLMQATRPLVLLGPAMCRKNLAGLRENLQSSFGIVPVAMESPRGLNDPVLGGIKSVCRKADHVLLLGKKPDFTLGFATQEHFGDARFAAVLSGDENIRLVEKNLGERCVKLISTAAAGFSEQLCSYISNENDRLPESSAADREPWNSEIELCLLQRPENTKQHDSELLQPAQITAMVERSIREFDDNTAEPAKSSGVVLICDGGEFGQWSQAGVRVSPRIINGPSGAIGGSLAYAVGAAAACPESLIVVMLGDGTAGFYLAELETIAREQVPAIIIVGNDSRWNAEFQIQLDQYGKNRTHSCELPPGLRYDDAARALGMAGELVESSNALNSAMARAMERASKQRQATLLNVIMQGQKAPTYR